VPASQVTGIDCDGGYAEYMIARAETLAALPDEVPAEEAGPFMCAGVTVYNAAASCGRPRRRGGRHPRHRRARPSRRAVRAADGLWTVAINCGTDKEPLARQLGAHHYIDSSAHDAVTELQKLGGARVILATAPKRPGDFGLGGRLVGQRHTIGTAAPAEPLTINVLSLISGRRSVRAGTPHARDSQDTMEFSA